MEVVFISKLCIMKLLFGKLKALLLSSNIYREIQVVSFHCVKRSITVSHGSEKRILKSLENRDTELVFSPATKVKR